MEEKMGPILIYLIKSMPLPMILSQATLLFLEKELRLLLGEMHLI
jgi:hypothetical protein